MACDLFVEQLAELLAVACVRDLLPPFPILVTRREATIHLGHHGHVRVSELTGDELVGHAGADGSDGVYMTGIVEPMVR